MTEFKKRSYQITEDIITYITTKTGFNGHIPIKKSIMKLATNVPDGNHEMLVSAFSIASKYNTVMIDIEDNKLFFYIVDNSDVPKLLVNLLDGMNIKLWGIPIDDFSFIGMNKDLCDILTKILEFINYLNDKE